MHSTDNYRTNIQLKALICALVTITVIGISFNAEAAKRRFKFKKHHHTSSSVSNLSIKTNKHRTEKNIAHNYIAPPQNITGIPNLRRVNGKTQIQGGGKKRERWKDDSGKIYEWDSRHGTLEKYDSNGKHLGEFDPNTGNQIKSKIKSRRVEP